jgi:hypothetical protein
MALADLLCLPVDGQQVESRRGYLSDRVVKGAAALVDSTELVAQWEQWYRQDHPDWETRGGRPGSLNIRTVLIVLVALVASGEPPLVSRVAEAIDRRLHTPARDLLGIPRAREVISTEAAYHRARRRLHWLMNVIDPYPQPVRGRRMTRAERDQWLGSLDRDMVESRLKRVQHVTNTLLESTARLLPTEVRARWAGNVCVDATLIRAWGKRGHPKAKPNRDNSTDMMSPEAIAGWYVRQNPDTGRNESYFGYEAHLAIATMSNPAEAAEFPMLVIAMTFDRPAQNVGENATELLKSIQDRRYPAGVLAGDRAYFPNPRPENLQLPARAMGYRLIGDYRNDQLGIQAEYGGAILVEGSWYCPSMPQPLIDATKDHRADRISDDTYAARIAQRVRYQFRPKHKPAPDGNTKWMCPARGPGATATCPLAEQTSPVALGMPTARTRIVNPPADPDVCCTNTTSITIPIAPRQTGNSNIAKYYQDIPYKSPEWNTTYSVFRNTIEGFNAFTKLPTEEDTEEPARRRIRGYAYQAFAVALLVLASNLRKINAWLRQQDTEPAPTQPAPVRRRRNALPDLGEYLPPADGPPQAIPA